MQSLDNLTDEERRQIYEEEEHRETERRRRRGRRPDKLWLAVVAFIVGMFALMVYFGDPGAFSRSLQRNEAQVREAGMMPTAPPSFIPTPAPTPATGVGTAFGDGVWLIGEQIPPGTYRASAPSSACFWARLADFSDLSRLNARSTAATDAGAWSAGLTPRVEVAWLRDTDAAFETVGCGTWRRLAE